MTQQPDDRPHAWVRMKGFTWECCKLCGIVRRADDTNKPCPGPGRIDLRRDDETPR